MKGLYSGKDAVTVLPAGEYDASIESTDSTNKDGGRLADKNGNPMQKVTFKLYDGGRTQLVSDWFIAPTTMWKYKQLATALGVPKETFDKGEFDAADFIGETVRIEVTVETSDQYGDSNKPKKYKPRAVQMPGQQAPTTQRVQAPRPEIPRQQTALKPRVPDDMATQREMNPDDIPF